MSRIEPFRAYRYSESAGPIGRLATQPYDKISPEMQARYLKSSPYNLVRVILGERFAGDDDANNVYTRAATYLHQWTAEGILTQDDSPSIYPYSQEFALPDSNETLVRTGFIALGPVVDYSKGIVHRHEQTLTGPKKDRMALLEHTRAHCEQLFLLYPDPECVIERVLEEVTKGAALLEMTDEYRTVHRLWRLSNAERVSAIQELMEEKRLLIADGHHRYETALAYRKAHPEVAAASRAMMTFVNMHSDGLRILATHRLVHSLPSFNAEAFLKRVEGDFRLRKLAGMDSLRDAWNIPHAGEVLIGIALNGGKGLYLAEKSRGRKELDVAVLHSLLLEKALEIGEEAVREQKYLRYVRGLDNAAAELKGDGQVAFLLEPCTVDQVARISFGGGVMPQKSTDFFPKLLSGLTLYRLDG